MSQQEENAKAESLAGAITLGCIVIPIALLLLLVLIGAAMG